MEVPIPENPLPASSTLKCVLNLWKIVKYSAWVSGWVYFSMANVIDSSKDVGSYAVVRGQLGDS